MSLSDQLYAELDADLAGDPCWRYFRDLATPGHRAILESKARLIGCTAAQRSGKTTVLRASAAAYFRGIHPFRLRTKPVKILVVAPSMAQLATIYKRGFLNASMLHVTEEQKKIWPDLENVVKRPLIPESEIAKNSKGKPDISWGVSKFGKVPGLIPHVDGSEMYFHISGDDNSWKRIEGMDFMAIFRDEADGNENIGNTFITRLMEHWDKPDYPDAGFYLWGASELQVVTERIEFLKKCQEGQKHYAFFRLDNSDNPKVTQKNREDAAEMLGKEEADKRIWGTTTAISGQLVYGRHFSRQRHVLQELYEPSPQANLWIGWDPGTAHPFGLVCAAIEPERPSQLRVVRCYSETRKTLDYQANCIAEWLDGRFLEGLVFDSAGATKAGYSKGESWFLQLEEALTQLGVKLHRGMLPGKNRYDVGIPLMWRYLDPDPSNNKADPLILINPPGPKSPGCETLIEQLLAYRFKKSIQDGAGLKGDAIHRLFDDLADPLRYLVSRQPRWVSRPSNHKRHQQFATSSIPFPKRGTTDPLGDDPKLPQEQRDYRAQLRASRAMVLQHTGQSRQRFREVRIPGW